MSSILNVIIFCQERALAVRTQSLTYKLGSRIMKNLSLSIIKKTCSLYFLGNLETSRLCLSSALNAIMLCQRRQSRVKTQSMIYKLGSKIRILRKEAGLTQEQLAEMVNVSVNFIGYIERGERAPSIHTLEQIAQGLDVDPKDLFEFSESESEDFLDETLLAALRKCDRNDLESLIYIAKQLGNRRI